MDKMIFGCGYLGSRVATRWQGEGDTVWALTRSQQRAAEMQSAGLRPVVADVTDLRANVPGPEFEFPDPTSLSTVLYSIGFDRSAAASMREVYVDGLRRVLDQLGDGFAGRFIYISSTGVYAQVGDPWVDESSVCEPTREGGRVCLEAERILAAHTVGRRSVVLRLAGIYGPDRVPRLDDVRQGRPLPVPAEGYLNLIHVDDAARAVLAAERHASPSPLYVVSDNEPVRRRDYIEQITQQLNAPTPRFTAPDPRSPAAGRAAASKRVRNRRMLEELRVDLRYPTYREGLAEILGNASGA